MTPFKLQNVPPPMSSFKLALYSSSAASPDTRRPPPVDLAFSPSSTLIAFLFPNYRVQLWELGLRTGPKGKIAEPKMIYDRAIDRSALSAKNMGFTCPRQIVLSEDAVFILGSDLDTPQDVVQIISMNSSLDTPTTAFYVSRLGRLIGHRYYEDAQGQVHIIGDGQLLKSATLPRFCVNADAISASHGELIVGLDTSGKLVSSAVLSQPMPDSEPSYITEVAHNVNSFSLTSEFLIFTTTAHEAKFVPISDLFSDVGEKNKASWGVRRVERGSRIVVVIPSTASVVLQLPRGNLETINPRPLVLTSVRADVGK